MFANARLDFYSDGIPQLVLRLKKCINIGGGVSTDNVNLVRYMNHI